MSYLVNDRKYEENLPTKNWFARKATFARSRVCRRHWRFMLHAACSVQDNVEDVEDIKTSHNRFLTDFLVFISLLLKMCTNYIVDSNMKSSNYSKIRFKPLNYFEFELKL